MKDQSTRRLPSPDTIKRNRFGSWYAKKGESVNLIGNIGYETCYEHYRLDRYGFPFLIIELVDSGEMRVTLDGVESILTKGHCVSYGPNCKVVMENISKEPCKKYFVSVSYSHVSTEKGYTNKLMRKGPILLTDSPYIVILKYFNLLFDLADEPILWESARLAIESLAQIFLLKGVFNASPSKISHSVYDQIESTILREFHHLKGLDDLAEKCGYSKSYMCQLFKEVAGVSPYQKLLKAKLEYACALLESTDWKVKAIADEVGFDDHLHFSKVFKQKIGISPSQFRTHLKPPQAGQDFDSE